VTRVDVGVVTWNTRDVTVEALRRLLETDHGVDVRVLVRDHASHDGTADAVEALGVQVDRHDGNPGFAAGVNALVRRSDASLFLALNSDAWPEPGALGRLVAALEQHPRAAVVAPSLRRPDGTPEPVALPFPGLRTAARSAFGTPALAQPTSTAEADWLVGAALLLRRAALDEVGGLDESFHMYAEDVEWCWRVRQAGWQVLVEPSAVVVHVGGASADQAFGSGRSAAVTRSTDLFLRRTRGPVVARAYQGLAACGAARRLLAARRRGDAGLAAHWRRELAAAVRTGAAR
jgi:N-acetylglucosaminyl-diphospho-decaprenol L-rhamnosyltransferase